MGICKLCLKDKTLSGSHIIPKTFLKRVKMGSTQLVKMIPESPTKPRLDNANWKMPLLCAECETKINIRYETSQINYLRNGRIKERHSNRVTFGQFDFDKFYLFWLSILWRASVADMKEFESVQLGEDLNELLRVLLWSGSTLHNGQVCISSFIRIGIIRLLPGDGFSDEKLKLLLTTFVRDPKEEHRNRYYLLIEGFFVTFQLTADPNEELPRDFGQIKRTFNFRMPAMRISESKTVTDLFNKMIKHAKDNPDAIDL